MIFSKILSVVAVSSVAGALTAIPGASADAPHQSSVLGTIWTVDAGANSVSEFTAIASGAAQPIAVISGSATELDSPSAVAVSATGTVYVANSGSDTITEYDPGATGDSSPSATISGSSTGLASPSSIVLSGHDLWVTNPATNVVEAFTAGSSGNELPAKSISGPKTMLNHPIGVELDHQASAITGLVGVGSGVRKLFPHGVPSISVINAPATGNGSITSYSSSVLGDVSPASVITGTPKHPLNSPSAILSDGFGHVLIADQADNSVTERSVLPKVFNRLLPRGRSISLSGTATGLDSPIGLTRDAFGELIVVNRGDDTIRIFSADSHGNASPVRTLTASGVPVSAFVPGTRPGAPRALRLRVHRAKTRRRASASLNWRPPADTGGGIIRYQVRVLRFCGCRGGGFVDRGTNRFLGESSEMTSAASTFTSRHLKLGYGYLFEVQAVNAFGSSRQSRPKVKVLSTVASAPRRVKASVRVRSTEVRWARPKYDGFYPVTSYHVEYGLCFSIANHCAIHNRVVAAHLTSAKIRGLKTGESYSVRVRARTRRGLGQASKIVTFTAGHP